jgi:hypothetical protein
MSERSNGDGEQSAHPKSPHSVSSGNYPPTGPVFTSGAGFCRRRKAQERSGAGPGYPHPPDIPKTRARAEAALLGAMQRTRAAERRLILDTACPFCLAPSRAERTRSRTKVSPAKLSRPRLAPGWLVTAIKRHERTADRLVTHALPVPIRPRI